jgi:DNA repair exonuclease SbcCD ATPase subunit
VIYILTGTAAILLIARCDGSKPDPADSRVQAEKVRRELEFECSNLSHRIFQLDTQRSVAETDEAIAQSASNADTKYAEDQYRGMVEREAGLAPGEGQGWRSVYKERAKAEASLQDELTVEIEQLQKELDSRCKGVNYSRF